MRSRRDCRRSCPIRRRRVHGASLNPTRALPTRRLALELLEDRRLLSNTPPVAAYDSYVTAEGTMLTVSAAPDGLLANDVDADGDPLTAALVDAPLHGSAAVAADGSFEYTPDAGVHGTDQFTYNANDGSVDSNVPAVVRISVGPPQLLKDINATTLDASPRSFIEFNGRTVFTADDGVRGRELWTTDGTAAGTMMVKDINPGSNGSSPHSLTNVNGTLFFAADDGTNGPQLWRSDGTAAGTVIVKDVSPSNLVNVNGTIFFWGNDGIHGTELWKSDGTAAGTVMVKDIHAGSAANLTYPTEVNGTIFFLANDGTNGMELWKSDGTEAGTVMVKDINPGSGSSYPYYLTNVNGTLFFDARDGTHGQELWESDGTAAGTVMVKDIYPGSSGSYDVGLTNVNGTLYFCAGDDTNGEELWKSDGTAAGTVMVKDINPGSSSSSPSGLTNVNGTLFLAANDGTNGEALWKSDGTAAGTVMVKDINPGTSSWVLGHLTNVNGTLFLRADDGTHGQELWKSDGTAAGTVMVKDIDPIRHSEFQYYHVTYLTSINGTLFFQANDGPHGHEIWRSDGTAAGTVMVKDCNVDTLDSGSGGRARPFVHVDQSTFFAAADGIHGKELWKTDGTARGTVMVKDIYPGVDSDDHNHLTSLTSVDGTLFFLADDGTHGLELWKSDGTAAGTTMVKDINPGSNGSYARTLINVNGTLYFGAYNETSGWELWKSDGTAAGTAMVKDIRPGSGDSGPNYYPTEVNGTLFFNAYDGTNGGELWTTDGTAAGTVMVKDIFPGPGSSHPYYLTDVNGTLFFKADDGASGNELWKSDGTAAGTVMVKDIYPGSSGSSPSSLTNVNGTLYFFANGNELWRSDGTTAGTVMVKDINPVSSAWDSGYLSDVNGTLFFQADDGTNGKELWKSDGTAAGTMMVKDINPGSSGSGPYWLTNVNGTLYFTADDGSTGYELWTSDGTAAGTVMFAHINSGSASAYPQDLTTIGNALYFSADDGSHGREPWTLEVNQRPTDIALDNSTVPENELVATLVGTFSTIDPNAGDTFTYTLVSGAGSDDNASFAISNDQLNTADVFDFEVQDSYSIRVRSTDAGGLWYEDVFTVSVADVNETPTDISLSADTVAENTDTSSGHAVGVLSGSDPDVLAPFSTLSFSVQGGADSARFSVDGSNHLVLTDGMLDFENPTDADSDGVYEVTVRVTDGGTPGLTYDEALTVTVTDVADGTPGNDVFEFIGGPAGSWTVRVNGSPYYFGPDTGTLTFDGYEGDDTATLTGTGGGDSVELWPGHGTLTGEDYTVAVTNVEAITVSSGGGADVARLHGSNGLDTFVATPEYGRLYGDGFNNRVEGFPGVTAVATAAQLGAMQLHEDVALLYDSVGSDVLDAAPNDVKLRYDGSQDHFAHAIGFRYVHGFAKTKDGKVDVANLSDSATTQDEFVAKPDRTRFYGPDNSFYIGAVGFEQVTATATGPDDIAIMADSAAADVFEATPDSALLKYGGSDEHFVAGSGFRYVYANALTENGGTDTASLLDSAATRDRFIGRPDQGRLFGPDFYLRANAFEQVAATATGPDDVALLFDSTGPDLFEASPDSATLKYNGSAENFVRATGFRYAFGYARTANGGIDTARLTSSATTEDRFFGKPDRGKLFGPDFDLRAYAFEQVAATAAGPDDTAIVYDSTGPDLFEASPDSATLKYSGSAEHFVEATSFRYVHGYAFTADGQTDTASLTDSATTKDRFIGAPDQSKLSGPGFDVWANGFEQVAATATAGGDYDDVAILYDSRWSDTFEATPEYGKLKFNNREDHFALATGFRHVHAYALAVDAPGSIDVAMLYDSPQNDVFYVTPTYARLSSGSTYYNRALYFDEVNAYATDRVSRDSVYFFDSSGDDHFEAVGNLAAFTTPGQIARAYDFTWVLATSSEGGNDTKHEEATDYLLETVGLWIDV